MEPFQKINDIINVKSSYKVVGTRRPMVLSLPIQFRVPWLDICILCYLDHFEMKGSSGGKTKMHHYPMRTSYVVSNGNNLAIALRESG